MSRKVQLSGLMRSWGGYPLYFCAMGALSAAGLSMGGHLTITLATWASITDETKPRTLSRVEKRLAIKASDETKIRLEPKTVVAAMTAPELPPAALAAAMDRTETASPIEYPSEHAAYQTARSAAAEPVRIAMVRPHLAQTSTVLTFSALTYSALATAPLVAGIACSAAGCIETDKRNMTVAMAAPKPASWPKPSRLGKGKPASQIAARPLSATERPKQTRKLASVSSPAVTGNAQSTSAASLSSVRIADSPGDIIRRSLRGTI